jgi:hypothetical protein
VKRVLENVAKLREKSRQYGDEISQLLGILPDVSDPRSGCFGMVFNHLTLTLELLSHYYSLWSSPSVKVSSVEVSTEERARIKKENAERCVMALKWLFIGSLSSIEYSAKLSVASYGEGSPAKDLTKVRRGQHVYLSDIMRNSNSKDFNLIDDDEYNDWQNLIFLRNCIVHNNGVSESDRIFDIAGIRVAASAGEMIPGKLDFFAIVTGVAIDRYFAWVKALIRRY